MNKWYSLELGGGAEAETPTIEIEEAFWAFSQANGSPSDMGVFSSNDHRHNRVTIYFTPSTKQFAARYNTQECDKPTGEDLGLIAGPPS